MICLDKPFDFSCQQQLLDECKCLAIALATTSCIGLFDHSQTADRDVKHRDANVEPDAQ